MYVDDEEEALQRERVVVDDVRAAEHRRGRVPSAASVTTGISAASTPIAAMRDVCHALAVGQEQVGDQHDDDRRRRGRCSGASACQSKSACGMSARQHVSRLDRRSRVDRDGRGVHRAGRSRCEDDVREDAERDDQQQDRRPRGPLERRDVVDVRVARTPASARRTRPSATSRAGSPRRARCRSRRSPCRCGTAASRQTAGRGLNADSTAGNSPQKPARPGSPSDAIAQKPRIQPIFGACLSRPPRRLTSRGCRSCAAPSRR